MRHLQPAARRALLLTRARRAARATRRPRAAVALSGSRGGGPYGLASWPHATTRLMVEAPPSSELSAAYARRLGPVVWRGVAAPVAPRWSGIVIPCGSGAWLVGSQL